MQLKIKRSQREGGVISKNVIFCLDARVEFTQAEADNIRRYKLHNEVLYNSEASKRLLDKGSAAHDGSVGGNLKNLAFTAMAAMRLNITVTSLQRGQHIECKSLDELLGAEEAIMIACQNLRGYLDTAATFDGREVVVSFADDGPRAIAQAAAPAPALVIETLSAAPQPALTHEPAPVMQDVTLAPAAPDAVAEPAFYEPEPQVTSAYAPSYGQVSSGFFSDGTDGEKERRVIGIVAAIIAGLVIIAILA